jgi:tetratricopeptide (TPR) repeat protein
MQGAVDNKRGRYAEALPRLLRATSACTEAHLDSEPACAYNWHYLSLTYLKLGRLDEADAAIDRNVELRSKLYGEKNPEYAKALITKGDILVARGRAAEAIKVLDSAQAIFAGNGQSDSLSGVNVLSARAKALQVLGRPAQALEVLDHATSLIERVAPKDAGRRLDLLVVRADVLDQLGRSAQAREAARAALELQSARATVDAGQWTRLETLAH